MADTAPMELMVEKHAWNRLMERLIEDGTLGRDKVSDRSLIGLLTRWGNAFAEFRMEVDRAEALSERLATLHPEDN